ncbi:hypothetical protein H4N54_18940 [Limnospira fusiformis KN01]|uniref:hypothetical protein n=1 Tax=Limnospira TaxID=2596745 RepID=UPI001658B89D|nr:MULTISPECIES: hypothetical protein [Limnospira]MDT9197896.1 hypothetical protein [Limnospira sp. PMC 1042.18]ULB44492.1 hypothetical protein H4N54_18940 [Limnospira fusiformis KN01]
MNHSPEQYITAIDRALSQDNFHQAADLACEAFKSYPNSDKIKRYMELFGPKTLEFHRLPPNPEMSLNFNWVVQNRQGYRGRWVALKGGNLVSDAASLDELKQKLGDRVKFLFCTVVY